ncbi:MAG: hypothetical protein LC772_03470 [Chloroflexi bacterium]|nr:hypothetical protein [Chloroflexota bacterium]
MTKYRIFNRVVVALFSAAAIALAGVAVTAQPARADVLDFEDVTTTTHMPLPSPYHGFTFSSSASVIYKGYAAGTGYDYGTFGNIGLFTLGAQPISMQGPSFDFNSAYITSAFQATENATVEGLRNGAIVYSQTITTHDDKAYLFTFNFQNVDTVKFLPIIPPGGTSNSNIVLDNITYNQPITPPAVLQTFTGVGWHLISSPYTIPQTFAGLSITAFAYDPVAQSYVVTPTPPADNFHIGMGYWFYLRSGSQNIPGPGTPIDNTQPFSVTLGKGWNLVGDPFTTAEPLSNITVTDSSGTSVPYTTALANHQVSNLFIYNNTTQSYVLLGAATDQLSPWDGAWIYSQQAGAKLVFGSPSTR